MTERKDAPVDISTSGPPELRYNVKYSNRIYRSRSVYPAIKTEEPRSTSTPSAVPSREPKPSSTPQLKTDFQTSRTAPTQSLLPGTSYPEVRTSTIDVDKVPNFTLPDGTTKPITEVEIDADLAENLKPWRRPGADPSDYFNYGFDEFTWSLYCQKQKTMATALKEQKDENAKINEMLMSQGMPTFPGLPPMPGMPSMAAAGGGGSGSGNGPVGQQGAPGGVGATPAPPQGMMEEMMTMMAQQGITDPSQLDWNTFLQGMQSMQGGGGAAGVAPSGPAGGGQQPAYGQQGWQQGGTGGYGGGGGGGGGGRRGRGGRGW